MEELAQVRQQEKTTKEALSQAQLDQSRNVDEYMRENGDRFGYNRGGRGVVIGPSSMKSRFLNLEKRKTQQDT